MDKRRRNDVGDDHEGLTRASKFRKREAGPSQRYDEQPTSAKKMSIKSSAVTCIISALNNDVVLDDEEDEITVYGLDFSRRHIKTFHEDILKLTIIYGYPTFHVSIEVLSAFNQLVAEFCAETLEELTIMHIPIYREYIEMFDVNKPFIRVKTLSISASHLYDQLSLFPQLFPSVNKLYLRDTNANNLSVRFNSLSTLLLDNSGTGFYFTRYKPFLRSNPHISVLHISAKNRDTGYFPKLTNLLRFNQNLTKLRVVLRGRRDSVTKKQAVEFFRDHVNHLRSLIVQNYTFAAGVIIDILNSFPLDFFTCRVPTADAKAKVIAGLPLDWHEESIQNADLIVRLRRT